MSTTGRSQTKEYSSIVSKQKGPIKLARAMEAALSLTVTEVLNNNKSELLPQPAHYSSFLANFTAEKHA